MKKSHVTAFAKAASALLLCGAAQANILLVTGTHTDLSFYDFLKMDATYQDDDMYSAAV